MREPQHNGILFGNSAIRIAHIRDGTSNTILLGERRTAHSFGNSGQYLDHWYIGSPQIRVSASAPNPASAIEFSEFVGATSVPMNALVHAPIATHISTLELAFGSYHLGGGVVGMADGSTHFLLDDIDPVVYRAMGSRAGGEVATLPP